MERFYLLRNNQESGPFTLSELKEKKLFTTDLLWQEDESTCWKNPAEIPLLQGIPLQTSPTVKKPVPNKEKQSVSSMPVYSDSTTERPKTAVIDDVLTTPCFEDLKRKYGQRTPRKKAWRKSLNIGANLIGLTTFVIGVMMAAFMVKKAIDHVDYEPPMVATAETTEITSETLPASTSQHAAFSLVNPQVVSPAQPVPTELKTETTTGETPVVPSPEPLEIGNVTDSQSNTAESFIGITQPENTEPLQSDVVPAAVKEETKESNEPAAKETVEEKPVSKSSLTLSANQFDVGFLGGISNLELSLSNPTSKAISKAVVEVEYLKPNGSPAGTKTVVVSGIAPGSSKKIAVPDHSRGVSVRYRVVDVE